MNLIQRTIRRVDVIQQRTPPAAFLWAVMKKFGNDSAGSLAALVAYYGFLSLFPLLLVLITVLGLVVTPATATKVIHSAISQFPIVGSQLTGPGGIHALKAGSAVGLVIGILGLVWGSLGICQAGQNAMARVWNVPTVDRPGYLPKLGRSVGFLVVLL
ncbi:MAG: YhjD/YihY/BrkB family envelope integrity protein, partial [Acidimicrobiales bacterium]